MPFITRALPVRLCRCAVKFEKTLNAEMRIFGGIVLGLCPLQIAAIVATWFLCWKRKAHDVVPDGVLINAGARSSALPVTSAVAAARDPYTRRRDPEFRPNIGSDEGLRMFSTRQSAVPLPLAQGAKSGGSLPTLGTRTTGGLAEGDV